MTPHALIVQVSWLIPRQALFQHPSNAASEKVDRRNNSGAKEYPMEPPVSISKRSSTLLTGGVAGLIGGLVEFGWVTLYADITGADPHQFAPGIVSAASVRALIPGRPPSLLAVIVNLSFAVVLGIVLTFAWRAIRARRPDLTNPLPFALAALAVVWAINFFVVLPILRPEFVHLVPYGVSLTSSLLFGAAVAAVLRDNLDFSSGTR